MRVLVVDDAAFARRFIRAALEPLKVELVEAANGFAGLKLGTTGNFDVIIADLNMPGLDGLQLVRQLRAGPAPTIPIFILSAGGSPELMAAGQAAGVTAWLVKPVQAGVIRSAVAKVLDL